MRNEHWFFAKKSFWEKHFSKTVQMEIFRKNSKLVEHLEGTKNGNPSILIFSHKNIALLKMPRMDILRPVVLRTDNFERKTRQ